MKNLLVSILALAAAACATAGSPSTVASPEPMRFRQADGRLVVCEYQRSLGSNFAERVCRVVQSSTGAENQRAVDELVIQPRTSAPPPPSGGR